VIAGKKPEIHFAKFKTIKLKKQEIDEIISQFEPELKFLLCCDRPEPISDFGIRAINYKLEDSKSIGTYFITSDLKEASVNWLP